MTIIKAQTYKSRIYAGGAHGNQSVMHTRADISAAAIADVVEMVQVPPGIKFVGLKLASAAGLGTSVTITVKVGDTAIATAVDAAAAFAASYVFVPFVTTSKTVLTVTIAGAEATGDLEVLPEYLAEGI